MSTAHDELFCRLALRQGLLSKEDANALLRAYRTESKTGEGIRDFAVQQGWVDANIAGKIENAIAHRASGHVDETKRRVPKLNKAAAGRTHAAHRHHHHGPPKAKATPLQATIFGVGAVVLIGAVVMLIMQLMSGEGSSPADRVAGDPNKNKPKPQEEKVAKFDDGKPKTAEERNYSKEELDNLRTMVDLAITTSRQDMSDGNFYRAVRHLKAKKKELGGDLLPVDMLTEFQVEIRDAESMLNERYDELVAELNEAKASGVDADVQIVLQEIEDTCGKESRDKAEGKKPAEENPENTGETEETGKSP